MNGYYGVACVLGGLLLVGLCALGGDCLCRRRGGLSRPFTEPEERPPPKAISIPMVHIENFYGRAIPSSRASSLTGTPTSMKWPSLFSRLSSPSVSPLSSTAVDLQYISVDKIAGVAVL